MIQLNEAMLLAMGFDKVAVNALKHFLRMVGTAENGQTLPETVMQNALNSSDNNAAAVAELSKELAALSAKVAAMTTSAAEVAELRKQAESYAVRTMFPPQATDWEHPGKLGEKIPNTGKITILNVDPANVGVVGFPSLYFSGDTTSGLYRPGGDQIAFSAAGANVVTWSATGAAYVQNVSTTKQLISTIATGTAPLSITSTTKVANLHVEKADALDGGSSYPADATDLPTAITLVNAIKANCISKGV